MGALNKNYAGSRPKKFLQILDRAIALRMELDENMARKSGVKKIFGGSMFRPGHPAPQMRVTNAEAHAKHLIQFIRDLPPFD